DLRCQPGQECLSVVGCSCMCTIDRRAVGKHHHDRADDQDAGDDGHTHIHTVLSAVQQGLQESSSHTAASYLTLVEEVVNGLSLRLRHAVLCHTEFLFCK